MSGTRDQIQQLRSAGRLIDAAQCAEQGGMHETASQLYEEACEFARAAKSALACGDAQRALVLAAMACDATMEQQAIQAVAVHEPRARATVSMLQSRGHWVVAGRLLDQLGDHRAAAESLQTGGAWVMAAQCLQRAGDIRQAARALESAIDRDPTHDEARVMLAELLVDSDRHEAAMRALQPIEAASPWRQRALPALHRCAATLGLPEAQRQIELEAERCGMALDAPAEPSAAALGDLVFGRYHIERLASTSPYAKVFEATDRLTGSRVALKQLLADAVVGSGRDAFARLIREAKALQLVRHRNAVPLVELKEDAGSIVTAWMTGGSLADLLSRQTVTAARAVQIAATVLDVLGEAHRIGILHRDVKPSNILFDDMGTPHLGDFGAAHVADSSATATAGVIGTLAYMSPEQQMGQPATTASDIYSVGMTLFEMLTGSLPVKGEVFAPSSVNTDLQSTHDAAVFAMIAQDPSLRPPSAQDARQALARLSWPNSAPRQVVAPPQSARTQPSDDRLQLRDGRWFDQWVGREVIVVPLSDAALRTARAYARTYHPSLPDVLRVSLPASQIWFSAPRGTSLRAAQRSLTPGESSQIAQALALLHEQGVAHGALDVDHVWVCNDGASIAIDPDCIRVSDAPGDMQMLRALTTP